MNHLDEGTIHAWLDGALNDAEGREVESHVASCAECRERVAEARGLIAGASRILGALDDVPGGVLPAGSRAAPTPMSVPAAPQVAPRPRRWATPWVTGIAALLVAAVVLRTGDIVRRSESAADLSARAAMDTVQAIIEAPSPVANAPASPVPAPTSAPAAEAAPTRRAIAELEATRDRERRVAGAPSATTGSVAGGAGVAAPPAREERMGFAAQSAPPAAPTPTPPPPAAPMSVAADMAQKAAAEAVTVTAAESPVPTIETALSGCYVVSPGGERMADAVAESRSGEAARTARAARPQMGAAAPAPAAAAPSVAARADLAGARLVSLSLVPTDSARAYVVRDARADSAIGTWRAIDSASAEIRFVGGQRVVVPRTIRTPCP